MAPAVDVVDVTDIGDLEDMVLPDARKNFAENEVRRSAKAPVVGRKKEKHNPDMPGSGTVICAHPIACPDANANDATIL